MGSFYGHVLPGLSFLILGLWHLFNHIKLHSLRPSSYTSSPWFPTSKIKYLELFFIIISSATDIAFELFIGPRKHHPFDVDGTIPSNHLRNFEHSLISLFFIVYALLAILLDKHLKDDSNGMKHSLTLVVGATAFGQELFLFRLHSTDHHGLEGQYHMLLQIIILVSLATTSLGVALPKSFLVSFIRSMSIVFQGVWFIVTGYMLWAPQLIPKGCVIYNDDGHKIVRCGSQDALERAKSLANIQFSWFLITTTIFAITFYLGVFEIYGKRVRYSPLPKEVQDLQEEDCDDDVEENNKLGDSKDSFIGMGEVFKALEVAR